MDEDLWHICCEIVGEHYKIAWPVSVGLTERILLVMVMIIFNLYNIMFCALRVPAAGDAVARGVQKGASMRCLPCHMHSPLYNGFGHQGLGFLGFGRVLARPYGQEEEKCLA